jgi:DNA (cytosine-5)-methyltransferase 1
MTPVTSRPTTTRPRLLDLCCGAGGASLGYWRAGFDVTGVDNRFQKRYPFAFVQADALEYLREHGREYDVIHASPPCQAHMQLRHWTGRAYPDLIPAMREALIANGRPYIIENVMGAPLVDPLMLCGSMFDGLRVIRHRLFETSVPIYFPPGPCTHPRNAVGRRGNEGTREWITVTGHFAGVPKAQKAMGIPWMTQGELAQAIPPAYTEFIGTEILDRLALAVSA